jgi:hypothetical protein
MEEISGIKGSFTSKATVALVRDYLSYILQTERNQPKPIPVLEPVVGPTGIPMLMYCTEVASYSSFPLSEDAKVSV